MRLAYADPPYPGCAHLYRDHADYGGEVDHRELIHRLWDEFDGWVLHTSSVALVDVLDEVYGAMPAAASPPRVMAWVKPFAAFKANVSVAYSWEPVIVKACRKPVVNGRVVMRDWIAEPITLQRGLTGVKPEAVCQWAFEVMGAERDDTLDDLYPGSGAVGRAWESWCRQLSLLG